MKKPVEELHDEMARTRAMKSLKKVKAWRRGRAFKIIQIDSKTWMEVAVCGCMKERPIIFSTEMVQAILKGRKTQTRRIIKPQPDEVVNNTPYEYGATMSPPEPREIFCPYGKPGDLLWVRESWADSTLGKPISPSTIAYMADYYNDVLASEKNKGIWKPSIYMPKAAARIWLEVSHVKVEKLQDISEKDAISEGIIMRTTQVEPFETIYQIPNNPTYYYTAKQAFMALWRSIHTKQQKPNTEQNNPWVWVVNFKLIKNIKTITS